MSSFSLALLLLRTGKRIGGPMWDLDNVSIISLPVIWYICKKNIGKTSYILTCTLWAQLTVPVLKSVWWNLLEVILIRLLLRNLHVPMRIMTRGIFFINITIQESDKIFGFHGCNLKSMVSMVAISKSIVSMVPISKASFNSKHFIF